MREKKKGIGLEWRNKNEEWEMYLEKFVGVSLLKTFKSTQAAQGCKANFDCRTGNRDLSRNAHCLSKN